MLGDWCNVRKTFCWCLTIDKLDELDRVGLMLKSIGRCRGGAEYMRTCPILVLGSRTAQDSLFSGSVLSIKRLSLLYVLHVDLSSWGIVRASMEYVWRSAIY